MGVNTIKAGNKVITAFKVPPTLLVEDNNAGKRLADFEILQKLGQGSFGIVIKVRSKLNSKIYAIKQLNLMNEDEEMKKKLKIELIILKKLEHPNVCKCVCTFEENGLFYIVMKYFNNKDLSQFLKGIYKINPPIKEEILWNIFYQCAEGLNYIHRKGIIHRDIKPENIFMDDNKIIQIGDFGISCIVQQGNYVKYFSENPQEQKIILLGTNEYAGSKYYMAPEVISDRLYDQRIDIYSLGVSFYELCYKTFPYLPYKGDMIELINDKNYSYELRDIIFKMIQKDKDKRINSSDFYTEIKKGYIKKYVKNSGIYSAIRCIFNFPNFSHFFSNNYIMSQVISTQYEKKILYIMLEILQSLNDKKNVLETIYTFRDILTKEEIKRKDNEEITPQETIRIILNLLNYELNEKINQNINEIFKDNSSKKDEYLHHEDIPGEELEKLCEFENGIKIKSFISKNFQGILKIKRKCSNNHENFLFRGFNFISFNCYKLLNKLNKQEFHIYDAFSSLNENTEYLDMKQFVKCPNCKDISKHFETKTIFRTPDNMIIFFDRSQLKKYNVKIDFDEQIMFNKTQVQSNFNKEYNLLGIISEIENNNGQIKYISFIKQSNKWILCDIDQEGIFNFENIKNIGNIICLFYYATVISPSNTKLKNNIANSDNKFGNNDYNRTMFNNKYNSIVKTCMSKYKCGQNYNNENNLNINNMNVNLKDYINSIRNNNVTNNNPNNINYMNNNMYNNMNNCNNSNMNNNLNNNINNNLNSNMNNNLNDNMNNNFNNNINNNFNNNMNNNNINNNMNNIIYNNMNNNNNINNNMNNNMCYNINNNNMNNNNFNNGYIKNQNLNMNINNANNNNIQNYNANNNFNNNNFNYLNNNFYNNMNNNNCNNMNNNNFNNMNNNNCNNMNNNNCNNMNNNNCNNMNNNNCNNMNNNNFNNMNNYNMNNNNCNNMNNNNYNNMNNNNCNNMNNNNCNNMNNNNFSDINNYNMNNNNFNYRNNNNFNNMNKNY